MAVVWNHFGAAGMRGAVLLPCGGVTTAFYGTKTGRPGPGSGANAIGAVAAKQADKLPGTIHNDGEVVEDIPARDTHVQGERIEKRREPTRNATRSSGVGRHIYCRFDVHIEGHAPDTAEAHPWRKVGQGELFKDRCGQRRQVRTRVDQEFDLQSCAICRYGASPNDRADFAVIAPIPFPHNDHHTLGSRSTGM